MKTLLEQLQIMDRERRTDAELLQVIAQKPNTTLTTHTITPGTARHRRV